MTELNASSPNTKLSSAAAADFTENSSLKNSSSKNVESPSSTSQVQNGLTSQQTTELTSQTKPKTGNRTNLVKQRCTLKCYSNQRKSKMGDLCGKSMSQSASAMSIKQQATGQQPANSTTRFDKEQKLKRKENETKFAKLSGIQQQTISDANNNTGSVKILVNDITPSNSQEFLLLQQRHSTPNSSRSSQTTSPIHKRALMQQSRSTSNLNNASGDLSNRPLIGEQSPSTNKDKNEKVSYLCHCTASNANLNKHKTRRRSWSYSTVSSELPAKNQIEQTHQTEQTDQIHQTHQIPQIPQTDQTHQNVHLHTKNSTNLQATFDQIKPVLEQW